MKKILRLVTTSVLTLTLVACGGNSSTSQSTTTSASTSTGPQSTSTTSSYAAVSSITLSAAAETLEQVSTSLQKVTVSATLNSGVNPAQELEWYVNGTKSSQTGKSFEYTPTAVGEYAIVAKVGSVSSNTVTVKVAAQGLEIESVKVVSSKSLEIKGPEGASIAIEGKTLTEDSYYDLINEKYVLTLKEAVAQGDTLKITLSKDGASKTTSYTYDTRTIKVAKLTGTSAAVKGADGSYTIIKPFPDAKETAKSYQISVATDDIVGSSVQFKVETAVPATATAINTTTSLEKMDDGSTLASAAYSVSKDTIVGDYTHTITVGDKTTSVVIHVVDPSETVGVVATGYLDDDATTVAVEYYPVQYDGSGVAAGADGSFEIERPYETIADAYELDFQFFAKYFALNEYGIDSTYTVSLTGPSAFGAAGGQLFDGIEMTADGTTKIAGKGDNALTTYQYQAFNAGSKTGLLKEVTQFITKDTPLGEYVFTISAGQSGAEKTASIKINIVAPEAKLSSKVSVVSEAIGTTVLTPNTDGRQVAYTYDKATNTYTFEKPLLSTSNYVYNFAFILDNGQSRVAELADTTADSLKTYDYYFQNGVFNLKNADQSGYTKLAAEVYPFETWATSTAYAANKVFRTTSGDFYKVATDGIADTEFATAGQTLEQAIANTPVKFTKITVAADIATEQAKYDKYTAYLAENISIYGAQTADGVLRVFSDYTYQVSSPSAGVKTTSGKYAIQLAADDTSILLANNGYSKSTADYGAYDASGIYAAVAAS